MIRNRSREDLRQDILSSLGEPIVKVNLTTNHLDNCINQAIKKFWRWHFDGCFESAYVYRVTQEDVDRNYFFVPEIIDSVLEVLPTTSIFGSGNFATVEWQMTASTVLSANRFANISLVDYVATQQRLSMTRSIVGADVKLFEFVRLQHRVIPNFPIQVDQIIALRTYENIDPESTDPNAIESGLLFDNETLKDLATAYAKQQWGMILKRFSGMTLPGGVVIDGETLIQEGKDDERDVMTRLNSENVVGFFMG